MASIKEQAEKYEPKKTLNIAELEKVSVDVEVKRKEANKKDGVPFAYNYIEVDNKEYRVPDSVLKALKVMIEEVKGLQSFKVVKTGTTKNDTVYTVVPLDVVKQEKVN